jgi:hypothetical protein
MCLWTGSAVHGSVRATRDVDTLLFRQFNAPRQRIKYRVNTAGILGKSKAKEVLAKQLASDEASDRKAKRWVALRRRGERLT